MTPCCEQILRPTGDIEDIRLRLGFSARNWVRVFGEEWELDFGFVIWGTDTSRSAGREFVRSV